MKDEARRGFDFRRAGPLFWIAAACLLPLGLALRIAGAQGELWIDEIWSLETAALLRSGGNLRHDLLWSLAFDNNHYLNTLYLALLGPAAPAPLLRVFSILLGVLTIAAAGLAMRRAGPPGMLAAMALFAVAYPLVNYGSEARGYAGLILMTMLTLILVEQAMRSAGHRRALLIGLCALIGVLFQPVMIVSLGIVGLWVLWRSWRATPNFWAIEREALRIFLPALLMLIPVVGLLAYAMTITGGYRVGGTNAFSLHYFGLGYGRLMRLLLGLPDAFSDWLGLAAAVGLALGVAWARRHADDARVSLYLIGLVLVPLLVLAIRPPNVEYPRYYLASGCIFLLLLADIFAAAWRGGPWLRSLGVAGAAVVALGTGITLAKFLEVGRGGAGAALQAIALQGGGTVTSNYDERDSTVLVFLAAREQVPVRYVRWDALCRDRPGWLLTSEAENLPETVEIARAGCTLRYRRAAHYPFWGLSGAEWTLYRAVE